jgi:UDP-2,3-diacylglucosamine hydrolase
LKKNSIQDREYKLYADTILVSDAHYNHTRDDFLKLLQDIDSGHIATTQLILVGDMFDLLVGKVNHTITYNKELIELLNSISKKIDTIYFEGNHDFVLSPIFSDIKVVPIESQPIVFDYNDKRVAISHGDFATGDMLYSAYLGLIRSPTMLTILNSIDFCINNYISKKIISNQIKKPKCRENSRFDEIVLKRLSLYKDVDIVIEGHYHQGKESTQDSIRYINLPAYVCTKEYKRVCEII